MTTYADGTRQCPGRGCLTIIPAYRVLCRFCADRTPAGDVAVPCACGGRILIGADASPEAQQRAVRIHNGSTGHREWWEDFDR